MVEIGDLLGGPSTGPVQVKRKPEQKKDVWETKIVPQLDKIIKGKGMGNLSIPPEMMSKLSTEAEQNSFKDKCKEYLSKKGYGIKDEIKHFNITYENGNAKYIWIKVEKKQAEIEKPKEEIKEKPKAPEKKVEEKKEEKAKPVVPVVIIENELTNKLAYKGVSFSQMASKIRDNTLTEEEKIYFYAANEMVAWIKNDKRKYLWKTFIGNYPDAYEQAIKDVIKAYQETQKKNIQVVDDSMKTRSSAGEAKTTYYVTLAKEKINLQEVYRDFCKEGDKLIAAPNLGGDVFESMYAFLSKRELGGLKVNVSDIKYLKDNDGVRTEIEKIIKTKPLEASKLNNERLSAMYSFVSGYSTGEFLRKDYDEIKKDPLSEGKRSLFMESYIEYDSSNEYFKKGAGERIGGIENIKKAVEDIDKIILNLTNYRALAALNPQLNDTKTLGEMKIIEDSLGSVTGKEIRDRIIAIQYAEFGVNNLEDMLKLYGDLFKNNDFRKEREKVLIVMSPATVDKFKKLDLTVQYALLSEGAVGILNKRLEKEQADLKKAEGENNKMLIKEKQENIAQLKNDIKIRTNWESSRIMYLSDRVAMDNIVNKMDSVSEFSRVSFVRYALPFVAKYAPPTSEVYLNWMDVIITGQDSLKKDDNITQTIIDTRINYQYLPYYISLLISDKVSQLINSWQGLNPEERMEVVTRFEQIVKALGAQPIPIYRGETEFGYINPEELKGWTAAEQAFDLFETFLNRYPSGVWVEIYQLYGLNEAVRDCAAYVNSLREMKGPQFDRFFGEVALDGANGKLEGSAGLALTGPESSAAFRLDTKNNPTAQLQAYRMWGINKLDLQWEKDKWEPTNAELDALISHGNSKDNAVAIYRTIGEKHYKDLYYKSSGGYVKVKSDEISSAEYATTYAKVKNVKGGMELRVSYTDMIAEAAKDTTAFAIGYCLSDEVGVALLSNQEKKEWAMGIVKDSLSRGGARLIIEGRKPAAEDVEVGGKYDTSKMNSELYAAAGKGLAGGIVYDEGKNYDLELRGYSPELKDLYGRLKTRYGDLGEGLYSMTIIQRLKDEGYPGATFAEVLRFWDKDKKDFKEIQLGWRPETQMARYLRDAISYGITHDSPDSYVFDLVNRYTGAGAAIKTENVNILGGKAIVPGTMIIPETVKMPFARDRIFLMGSLLNYYEDNMIGFQLGGKWVGGANTAMILMSTAEKSMNSAEMTRWNVAGLWRNWTKGSMYVIFDEDKQPKFVEWTQAQRLIGGVTLWKYSDRAAWNFDASLTAAWDPKNKDKTGYLEPSITVSEKDRLLEWSISASGRFQKNADNVYTMKGTITRRFALFNDILPSFMKRKKK